MPPPKPLETALIQFPTAAHSALSMLAVDFFTPHPIVDTVLLLNSCARNQAAPESDLDMGVLVKPSAPRQDVEALEVEWRQHTADNLLVRQYLSSSSFAHFHLDLLDGRFSYSSWDEGGGPDYFEVEIGNLLAYSAPVSTPGPYFRQLQQAWLPYYDEEVRASRLEMVRSACSYDLDFIPFYVRRGLYFQAFDRLYKAFQEFLQALFITRRVYPLAYNKWIREQVENWLELPALYRILPSILSIENIESEAVAARAADLRKLLEDWTG
jgi:hypothetical protein